MNNTTRQMIETQLIPRGIKDKKVLSAIEKVQRHLFVAKTLQDHAYADHPLPIGEDQTISQPFMVAVMTELLELSGSEKVLEVGTGSGYQTAILAEIAEKIYTIDRIASLSQNAQAALTNLGYDNVFFKIGDGTQGWKEEAPFDSIIVTAGASMVPPPLFEQLSEGGRIVIPIGERFTQTLTIVEKINGKMKTQELDKCVFVPLVGKYGMIS